MFRVHKQSLKWLMQLHRQAKLSGWIWNRRPARDLVAPKRWQAGEGEALDALVPTVYAELKRLARAQIGRDGGATIQPTELVAEAYIKLLDIDQIDFLGRAHFTQSRPAPCAGYWWSAIVAVMPPSADQAKPY